MRRSRISFRPVVVILGVPLMAFPLFVRCVDAQTLYPWSQTGHDAAHTWASNGPSPAANTPYWTSSIGGGVLDTTSGLVTQGQVFLRHANGVVALDQRTGAFVRMYSVGSVSSLGVSGTRLIVGELGGTVQAFDANTGEVMWSRMTAAVPSVAVADGRVFVNTGISDGHLRALDEQTGNLVWDFIGIAASSSTPTVANGLVFQNSHDDSTVVALDETTGRQVWRTAVGAFPASSVVADTTRLFVGTQSGHLVALDQGTGTILWDRSLGGEIYAGGTVNGLAFANSFSGVVYALDAATGAVWWSFDTRSGFQTTGLASASGRVFFSTQTASPTLYALDGSTGSLLWSYAAAVGPIVADGLVFAMKGGEVVALGNFTAFASMSAAARLRLGPAAHDDAFGLGIRFTLGAGSNGIAPPTEEVRVGLGTASFTIPAASFKPGPFRSFVFQGVVEGVGIGAAIYPTGPGTYDFGIVGIGADLTGITNPVPVRLTIGNDGGSTFITATFVP